MTEFLHQSTSFLQYNIFRCTQKDRYIKYIYIVVKYIFYNNLFIIIIIRIAIFMIYAYIAYTFTYKLFHHLYASCILKRTWYPQVLSPVFWTHTIQKYRYIQQFQFYVFSLNTRLKWYIIKLKFNVFFYFYNNTLIFKWIVSIFKYSYFT